MLVAMASGKQTPAMRQYHRFKERHPGCVLFFRMGDFYEMFDDDAVEMSKALGLTLTERSAGQPMAGVPYHQLDTYLRRAVEAGYRVAIADQIQDPAEAKGVVARAVTRVVTPGTQVDAGLVSDDAPCRLAAVCPGQGGMVGAAVVEVSTGTFVVFECGAEQLADELARRAVREVAYPEERDGAAPEFITRAIERAGASGTALDGWRFKADEAQGAIREHFGVSTLAGFGLEGRNGLVSAAGALLAYVRRTQTADPEDLREAKASGGTSLVESTLAHLSPPRLEEPKGLCVLDSTTLRALEVERTIRGGAVAGSLLGLFIGPGATLCRTPMGKRLVRDWLCAPLADLGKIEARHAAVASLVEDTRLAEELGASLGRVQDVARIAGRLALGRRLPRDLLGLGTSLGRLPDLLALLEGAPAFAAARDALSASAEELTALSDEIRARIREDSPATLRDGGVIADGVDPELDEARSLQHDASAWLSEYQSKLSAQHDLPGLKVGFNRVFGYYIELPRAQARTAPDEFSRRQTLKNAERFITPELKAFEEKVQTAEARALEREKALFEELCELAHGQVRAIGRFAQVVASLDVLLGFAGLAARRSWVRPEMTEAPVLRIRQGRHPVLEEVLRERLVPNDAALGAALEKDDEDRSRLALITGPNMAGKSTYIRQVALIVLLAHAGSFVPAEEATIGLCDRIFTRVGADDALHQGQSTFMVEMAETANILNHATERSLVILDEIGRGTSTLDGLSLAWAVAEELAVGPTAREGADQLPSNATSPAPAQRKGDNLHNTSEGAGESKQTPGPRTLFATHYHELTQLEERAPGRVRNLHVAVREWGDEIVFIHRILPGRTDQSYGIHVARLAGVPQRVVERARALLATLAVQHGESVVAGAEAGSKVTASPRPQPRPPVGRDQLSLFSAPKPHPAVDALREVKLEGLSPLQAFDELRRLKGLADAGRPEG